MKARVVLSAIVLWSIALAAFGAVGRTPGNFEVSATGAARYTVPLWMPRGPLGMQPQLALDYSSENGNGVLGVGWALSGLSSIERCNRTVAQDGVAVGVGLSAGDRFCLNGNKLRLLTGTYGAASSTYRTEIYDYSTIVAVGTVGTGPERFTVKTKDGTTLEYGGTADSRVVLGSSVYRWKLNKATDASGNSYVVTYNNVEGNAYPATVEWAATSAGGSTYIHRAIFNYSTGRTAKDSLQGYVVNHQVSVTRRLEDIQIRSTIGGVPQTVRRYFFTYDTGSVTLRSRLTQIKECADDAATDCLAPTVISYQAGLAGVTTASLAGPSVGPTHSNLFSAYGYDFNGDQREDLLYTAGGYRHVAFATNGGFTTPVSTGIPTGTVSFADRFATGEDGLLANVGGTWWYYRWTGTAFSGASTGTSVTASISTEAVDADGDGLKDLVWMNSARQVYIRLNTSVGTAATPTFSSTANLAITLASNAAWLSTATSGFGLRHYDLEGDGRQDLYVTYETGLLPPDLPYYSLPLYSRGTTLELGTGLDGWWIVALDFNDDGCTDRFIDEVIYVSRCANSAGIAIPVPSPPIVILDWDGDGRSDIAVANGTTIGIYRSTGTGLSALESTSIPYAGGFRYFGMDQDGDSMDDIVRVATSSPYAISYFTHSASGTAPPFATNVPDLASSFTDGYGVNHTIGYVSTGRSNYTEGAVPALPLKNLSDPAIVVGQVTSSDATGGNYNRSYTYSAGRQDKTRRTFAGFEQRTVTDGRTNLILRETYEQLFPLTGYPKKIELLQSNGTTLISETTNTFQSVTGGGTHANWAYPYLRTSVAKKREMGGSYNGVLLSTATTTNTVDAPSGTFSRIETVVAEESGGNGLYGGYSHTTTKTIAPYNDTTNQCLGKPGTVVEERSHTGALGTLTQQTTNHVWDGLRCRLNAQIIEPGSARWEVTTDYAYDSFGNVSTETVTPVGQPPRVTTFGWGASGQFLHSVTNALSQATSFGWNLRTGYLESMTETLNLTPSVQRLTDWTPDTFGRLQTELRGDLTSTSYVRTACTAGNSYCGIGASDVRFSVAAELRETGGALIRADTRYFDGLERERFSNTQLIGGVNSRTRTTYDSLGKVATTSAPYIPSVDTPRDTSYDYDDLGRLLLARRWKHEGDSSYHDTVYEYKGWTTTLTNARGFSTHYVSNAWGNLVRVTDAASNSTNYQYNPFGYLGKSIDSASNETTMTYTSRGLKLTSASPDMGGWSYDYFPLGEIKSQTDAKTQTTSFSYDALSRMLTRADGDGTIAFVWDTATNGIGQLASASSLSGYVETYQYDAQGRPTQTNITADSTTYSYDYGYSSTSGFIETLTYPTSSPGFRLKLRYGYDTGQLKTIQNYSGDVAGVTFWDGQAMNARGQYILEAYGNGLITSTGFDPITGWMDDRATVTGGGTSRQNFSYLWNESGSLTQRVDGVAGTTETFLYDSLDRMYQSSRNGSLLLSVGYDAIGNISNKTGIGTYTYHAAKKHAVTATTTGGSYGYDANGNMDSRNGYAITWYRNNLPKKINGSGFSSEFWYGPTGARWKHRTTTSASVGTLTYIGPFIERLVSPATNEMRHYIYAPTGPIIMYKRPSTGVGNVWNYISTDHLGSSDVFTNAAGGLSVNQSITAFGERKAADGVSSLTAPEETAYRNVTRRGFGFHEHIDQLGLIHMNGRVYDPALGRFISADPYVQAPFNGQSFNRYSYVLNNPLSFTDPSGFAADCPSGPDRKDMEGVTTCVDRYPDLPSIPDWSVPVGPVGGGGGAPGSSDDAIETVEVTGEKCWNGEEGGIGDFFSGLLRQVGNDFAVLGAKWQSLQNPFNPLNELQQAMAADTFGSNNTNMGIFGSDLAPAAMLVGPSAAAGVARFSVLRGGTQGAREFLGLVGNRAIQMDHVFIQRAGGGNTYWNLYPTASELNRLMGQANNWTLSNDAITRGAIARFIQNGKLGATAGASLGAGDAIGMTIAALHGCN